MKMINITVLRSRNIDEYDVRRSTVADLIDLCVGWYPEHFGKVVPHNPKSRLLELQRHIGLSPSLCVDLYDDAVQYYDLRYFRHYGIGEPAHVTHSLDYRRMRRPGMTVRDFHQLLWQHANLLQFRTQQELFIPYPKSDVRA